MSEQATAFDNTEDSSVNAGKRVSNVVPLSSVPAVPVTEGAGAGPLPPIKRLGTAHRLETLRMTGILDRSFSTVVDIGGYDGAISGRLNAERRIVVEPFPPARDTISSNVELIRATSESMPLASSTADLVLMMDVLEHVDDPVISINEVLRVLKPGGTAIVTVPSKAIRVFPWFLQGWVNRRWDHRLRSGYEQEEIESLVKDQGGELVRSIPLGSFLFRTLYLPVSFGWRIWGRPARAALNAISRFDYRFRNFGERNGYLFFEFRRPLGDE